MHGQHPLTSSRISLRDYVIRRVPHAPIAAFGKESTIGEHRARAAWERAMASALRYRGEDTLVEAHERTAATYDRRAADMELDSDGSIEAHRGHRGTCGLVACRAAAEWDESEAASR